MHRREFAAMAASAIAAGSLSGCGARQVSERVGAVAPGPMDAHGFHCSRRFARTVFGQIAYVERGTGPSALFIHGLPLNGFQWRGALERLSQCRRCIAPDSMGLGYSEIPAVQDLSPGSQVKMLAALLNALGVDDVDIVASDSGGAIAQIFVAEYPDRARSLLLTNCDVHEDSPPPALLPVIDASRAGKFVDDVLVPQLRDKSRAGLATGLGGCCYSNPSNLTPEAIDCYLAPLASSPVRKAQFHNYCIALARNPLVSIEAKLRKSRVPMRVVWGTGDTIFNPSGPDWLDRTFPASRGVRLVSGANLFFPEEMPDLIAEEARRLWLGV